MTTPCQLGLLIQSWFNSEDPEIQQTLAESRDFLLVPSQESFLAKIFCKWMILGQFFNQSYLNRNMEQSIRKEKLDYLD